MGRVVTPKYSLEIEPETNVLGPHFRFTPAAWRVKEYGKPTAENLAAYVAKFEASTAPGGFNSHLGPVVVRVARIKRNVAGGAVVAAYSLVDGYGSVTAETVKSEAEWLKASAIARGVAY